MHGGKRLFPGRGRCRRALLVVSRGRWRGPKDRFAPLVFAWRLCMTRYAELQCASNFSFLRGASSAEQLFAAAALLGIEALAITDLNSLAGIVRAHEAAKATGVRLIAGCRLQLREGTDLLVYPQDRPTYSRLCRLLSLGKSRTGKANCDLGWEDVATWSEGLLAILIPHNIDKAFENNLARLKSTFPDRAYCAMTLRRRPREQLRLAQINNLATAQGVPTGVTNDVLFHSPEMRILQDVITCIRERTTIDDVGFKRERHADRYVKAPDEMARLFRLWPDAVARSAEIADVLRFSLNELAYQYPHEVCLPGLTPQQALEQLTWEGTKSRYPEGLPESVDKAIRHELSLIEALEYAPYFLTVDSIVRFTRSKGILCQGRGSAANSAVCYVLGVTSIDPVRQGLLFERFVSEERREPPDIDVDFEHERREEVIQWIYETYGKRHAALTAVVSRFRTRGALREVGKVMGLSEDMTAALAGQVWGVSSGGLDNEHVDQLNLDRADPRLALTLELVAQLVDTPRHLSQHPGGFVLAHSRLDDLVPVEPAAMVDRRVVEWEKLDVEELARMKVDILGLGMLGCMRRAFELLETCKGVKLSMASPEMQDDDEATYAMIQEADTLGVFQIESRAQMSMLPRMKPAEFYDLVIEVAIVRPGPIQGDMVHPYLKRRGGKEPVTFPCPDPAHGEADELEKILGRTLGVPIFQEQAMKIALDAAKFSSEEASQLRKAMATFRSKGKIEPLEEKMVGRMVARGYDLAFAQRCFDQIKGFGEYGFPE